MEQGEGALRSASPRVRLSAESPSNQPPSPPDEPVGHRCYSGREANDLTLQALTLLPRLLEKHKISVSIFVPDIFLLRTSYNNLIHRTVMALEVGRLFPRFLLRGFFTLYFVVVHERCAGGT